MNASEIVSLGGLMVAFTIFLTMAIQEGRRYGIRAVRNLKFQLALATFVWLIGESLTVIQGVVYGSYDEFLEVHTISMGIFALTILLRLPHLLKRAR